MQHRHKLTSNRYTREQILWNLPQWSCTIVYHVTKKRNYSIKAGKRFTVFQNVVILTYHVFDCGVEWACRWMIPDQNIAMSRPHTPSFGAVRKPPVADFRRNQNRRKWKRGGRFIAMFSSGIHPSACSFTAVSNTRSLRNCRGYHTPNRTSSEMDPIELPRILGRWFRMLLLKN